MLDFVVVRVDNRLQESACNHSFLNGILAMAAIRIERGTYRKMIKERKEKYMLQYFADKIGWGTVFIMWITLGVCTVMPILIFFRSRNYRQIGDTCGFYALVYAVSKVKNIDKKQTVKQLITESIEEGTSNVGEIFDIDILDRVAKRYFPDLCFEIVSCKTVEDVDAILMAGKTVVFPYLYSKIPHYCVIEGSSKAHYICRHGYFKSIQRMSKEELVNKNIALDEYTTFKWKDYYDQKVGSPVYDIIFNDKEQKWSDKELFTFLKQNRRKKKSLLYDSCTDVNLGSVLLAVGTGEDLMD